MSRLIFSLLMLVLARPSFAQEVWYLVPAPQAQMQQAIAYYQQLATQQWQPVPGKPLITPGTGSAYVPRLRQNLVLLGDLREQDAGNDDKYTSAMATAVANFQERHGLKPDSVYGPKTAAAMNVSPARRLLQLQNSLSRWNSFSQNLQPPYVLVNIPEFELRVIDSNRVRMAMRIIVGKPQLRTVSNRTDLYTIVFNPSWNIPRSIASKEILPILKRNPGYLAKRDMELFKPTVLGAYVRANPWQVNWRKVTPESFDFRIVQQPGKQNELGKIKFLFHTHVNQYLHDTNDKLLFGLDYRALSHGCIRVQHPVELARYLLQERSGLSAKKTEKFLTTSKPEQFVRLKKPVPLLVTYLSAWVDELGRIQFRDDIYGYDKALPLTLSE